MLGSGRARSRVAAAVVAAIAATFPVGSPAGAGDAGPDQGRDARLRAMRAEISRLETELEGLGRREAGLLGEVARLGAELRLREEEERAAALVLETVTSAVESRTADLERLERQQAERSRYLAYRLRETCEAGSSAELRRVLTEESADSLLQGFRYAAYLGERDARLLREFREDAARARAEREALLAERSRLERSRGEARLATEAAARSRAERAKLLDGIRLDRGKHEAALAELAGAAHELGDLVSGLSGSGAVRRLDVRRFRGLLHRPVAGAVSEGFGEIVHPRFKTVVPHPGFDFEAEAGTPFRSVFEGRVAFASWLHGYGLTVIVDHGGDVMSVYAHASALTAEPGQEVLAGDVLGYIGDSASLRGPYLYFEIRESGRPVDPVEWLSRR